MDFVPLIAIGILFLWLGALSYLFYRQESALRKIKIGSSKENIIEILSEVLEKQQKLDRRLVEANKKVEGLLFDSQFYIQKIGLVRFNPFNDTGGDQSFILALLDAQSSGVVISGLHTRNGTRWYAKKIRDGHGVEHELSDDEIKAIKTAKKRE